MIQALWVVEPERLHDLNDMHYGGYYNDDDWGGGGGWGEKRALPQKSCALHKDFLYA